MQAKTAVLSVWPLLALRSAAARAQELPPAYLDQQPIGATIVTQRANHERCP